ncbi:surface carbohydrate biosynthesis protein [Vibrio sp. NH-7]
MKFVYQIVDSPSRDLEWRLFFAYELQKNGISSCVGLPHDIEQIVNISKHALLVGRFGGNSGRGVFDKRLIRAMKENSIDMFFWHDEGAFYFEDEYESAVKRIYPEDYFGEQYMKHIYFWGKKQLEVFEDNENKNKFKVLGSPRLDLFKREYDYFENELISRIKSDFGDFTLICSRFAGLNPVKGDITYTSKRMLEIKKEANLKSPDEILMKELVDVWRNVSIDHALFISSVFELCHRYPKESFVYRPHPAENTAQIEDIFSVLPNVIVSKEHDLRTVAKASKCVIHSESTSGLESAVSGVETINFVTNVINNKKRIAGVNLVGEIVSNSDDLISVFEDVINNTSRSSNYEKPCQFVRNYNSYHNAMNELVEDVKCYYKNADYKTSLNKADVYNVFKNKSTIKYLIRKLYVLFNGVMDFSGSESKKTIKKSDMKRIKDLWKSFGGDVKDISFVSGVIFICVSE